jgi:hypothetical protein
MKDESDQVSSELGFVLLSAFLIMLIVGDSERNKKANDHGYVFLRWSGAAGGTETPQLRRVDGQPLGWLVEGKDLGNGQQLFLATGFDSHQKIVLKLPDRTIEAWLRSHESPNVDSRFFSGQQINVNSR